MKAALDDGAFLIYPGISGYFVDEPMFHGNSSGPVPFEAKTEGFRFARAGIGGPVDRMDQPQNPGSGFPVGFQPVSEVFPAMRGKLYIHCSILEFRTDILFQRNSLPPLPLIHGFLKPPSVCLCG